MRIQLLSDTHFEFQADLGVSFVESLDPTGVDVLILAGDICTHSIVSNSLRMFAHRFPQVIYVPGNHEFYDSSIPTFKNILKEIKLDNLHILHNNTIEIQGKRFMGNTLWFPPNPDNLLYTRHMSDFQLIKNLEKDVYIEHLATVNYLEKHLSEGDIVVSHHLPSNLSIHPKFSRSPLNRFFVSPLDDLILEKKPAYWFHGHTHSSVDYQLGDTRIVCNPFGYAGYELNSDFIEKLIIEIV